FLLALAACSGTSENSSNGSSSETSSNEQMNSESMNESEAGDAMENEEAAVSQEDSEGADSSLTIMIKEEDSDDHNEHGEDHGAEIGISLQNDEMDPTLLMTEIQKGDQPLTEGDVRFEYWKEGEEKHIYTDTEEKGEGMYEGMAEISEPGTYNLKVHVEKGEELHTHKPYVLEVTEK
ncbi:MAG: FixH family protein, partial [Anaerobacillus sp.]